MARKLSCSYEELVSLEDLLDAWQDFVAGKRMRADVQDFEQNLMGNIIGIHVALVEKTYNHAPYEAFKISDPKPRDIHKAAVGDRLVHRALYRILYPYFDARFIADSYSCRLDKGTHKALDKFRAFANVASLNYTRTVWVLQCDVRKFFASIDQNILLAIISRSVIDADTFWLIRKIIDSFHSTKPGVGLPLGNLTSQLFVNIYMNEFDQFVKKQLKARHYIRYADDFVIFSQDREWLEAILLKIRTFLRDGLKLELHPNKVKIRTLASGVDFLGWVHFNDHRVLRTVTKKRMLARIAEKQGDFNTLQSYLGLLSHGNTGKIRAKIESDAANLDKIE